MIRIHETTVRTTLMLLLVAAFATSGGANVSPSLHPQSARVTDGHVDDPTTLTPHDEAVVRIITREFWKSNSRIDEVTILDFTDAIQVENSLVILARGIRGDHRFEGTFKDELFGLFIVDVSRPRVTRQLAIIPTQRWNDYTMRIEQATPEAVVVSGEGTTYGDARLRQLIPLE